MSQLHIVRAPAKRWVIGDFLVDAERHYLLHKGLPVALTPKQFDTLVFMVRNAGRLLTKEELLAGIWPDSFVEESNLSQNIFWLRKALRNGDGEDAANRYIVTVPGKGYRFVAEVTEQTAEEAASLAVEAPAAKLVAMPALVPVAVVSRPRWLVWAAVGMLLVLVAVGGVWAWNRHEATVRRAKSFPYKPEVIISAIQNATDDPSLTAALNSTLRRGIFQSPWVVIVPRTEINKTLGYMQLPVTTPVTTANEQAICMRRNSTAWINTSIIPEGAGYIITVEADNCVTGKVMSIGRATAEKKEQVLLALDSLLPRLRQDLGESADSVRQFTVPVENATTGSLEAFKAFLAAEDLRMKGENSKAVPILQRAIQFDPNFQLAYTALGTVYMSMEEREQALAAFRKAYELRGRGTPRERFYTEVFYTRTVLGDLPKAYELNLEWEKRYPSDPAPWVNGTDALNQMDRYQDAAAHAEKGLSLFPGGGLIYVALAIPYLRVGRYDDVKRLGEKAVALHIDGWQLHEQLWQTALLRGDDTAAAAERATANGTSDEYGALNDDLSLDFRRGQAKAAMAGQKAFVTAALAQSSRGATDNNAGMTAFYLEELGLHANALAYLHGWKASDATPELGLAYAATGVPADAQKAESVVGKLTVGRELDTLANHWYAPTIRAELAMHAKGVSGEQAGADALAALQPIDACGMRQFIGPYLRGKAQLMRHDSAAAETEFQRILDAPGVDAFSPLYPLAALGLARARAASGNAAGAREAYQRLLKMWEHADPDLPALVEAKREMAKLS